MVDVLDECNIFNWDEKECNKIYYNENEKSNGDKINTSNKININFNNKNKYKGDCPTIKLSDIKN